MAAPGMSGSSAMAVIKIEDAGRRRIRHQGRCRRGGLMREPDRILTRAETACRGKRAARAPGNLRPPQIAEAMQSTTTSPARAKASSGMASLRQPEREISEFRKCA